MKRALALLLCVGLAAIASASVLVRVQVCHLAKQRSKITVLLNGAPLAQTTLRIDVRRDDPDSKPLPQRHLKLTTNSKGAITLPRLHPGYYSIYVRATPNASGSLALAIAPPQTSPHYSSFVAHFRATQLQTTLEATPAAAFQLNLTRYTPSTGMQMPTTHLQLPAVKICKFHGTVRDPGGAPIPHAEIAIYEWQGSHKQRIKKFTTNKAGMFSASLRPGKYLATFSLAGFQVDTLPLVISSQARCNPLKITLHLAAATQ